LNIESYEQEATGLTLRTDDGLLRLDWITSRIVRVRYTRRDAFGEVDAPAIVDGPADPVEWHVTETPTALTVASDALRVCIDRDTGVFTWLDATGRTLCREAGKQLNEIDVEVSVFDASTRIETSDSVDGARARAVDVKTRVDRQAYQTRLSFDFFDDEAIHGFGQHEEGIFDHRGTHQYLYQQNMKASVPVMVSSRGYGILFNSYGLMTFHDDDHGSYVWTDCDEAMDYYFIAGPGFDEIVAGYRRLTGAAPMLPRWAFGYCQSKERYKTQDELIQIVGEYRRRQIPLDLIIQDWCTWIGDQWGQKSFDPERFPAPGRLCDELHAMGAKLMISIWPIMRNDGANQVEMRRAGRLLGNDATYDAFNPEARALYWKQAKQGLFDHGIDAWWCDCTEPFEADWNGQVKPEPWKRVFVNTDEMKRYLDPAYINAYSLLHSRGIYEGQRATTQAKRVVNLTRSSFAGQQRYGAITWSGDIAARWDVLRAQIAAGLNFCATGCPYWTLDIGAFFCRDERHAWFLEGDYDAGVDDLGYRELYVRWFQLGAFLPMFRSHGTDTPREVWRFGEPGDPWYDTLVRFDKLRYRLMPYIYTLAGRVTHQHDTIMRMLTFDFAGDPEARRVDDQFMFGPSIMVCPVTEPMYHDADSVELTGVAKAREVYLPDGCDWYDFWTGERQDGGQCILADAPLQILPLFVRAGSLLPMGPVVQHTGEAPDAPIELRIYPGADGRLALYDDAGDGYDYEQGAFAWTSLEWNDAAGELTIGPRDGFYPGMPETRRFDVVLVDPDHGVGDAPAGAAHATIDYDGTPVTRAITAAE
jgi:alpha-D-xyloside xylohydrolase